MIYHPSEFEKLKAQVFVIASNYGISTSPRVGMFAKLRAQRLTKEEIKKVKDLCGFYDIDFDSINPYEKKKRQRPTEKITNTPVVVGTCAICGRFGKVCAHHYAQRHKIIICPDCHMRFHRKKGGIKELFSFIQKKLKIKPIREKKRKRK